MEAWAPVTVALVAVLVGAAIPALVQLRATLRAVEKTVLHAGGRLGAALETTNAAAVKIDALATRLAAGNQIETLVRDVTALRRVASQVGDVVRVASAVGAAVGPAVAAGIRALREEHPAPAAWPAPVGRINFKNIHPQSRKLATS